MADTMEGKFREELLQRKTADSKSVLMTKEEYFLLLEDLKVAFQAERRQIVNTTP